MGHTPVRRGRRWALVGVGLALSIGGCSRPTLQERTAEAELTAVLAEVDHTNWTVGAVSHFPCDPGSPESSDGTGLAFAHVVLRPADGKPIDEHDLFGIDAAANGRGWTTSSRTYWTKDVERGELGLQAWVPDANDYVGLTVQRDDDAAMSDCLDS